MLPVNFTEKNENNLQEKTGVNIKHNMSTGGINITHKHCCRYISNYVCLKQKTRCKQHCNENKLYRGKMDN